ncbi:putative PurR-regulated permease PerM [Loktanella ponticola]|uniref:Putative PurR-regulated permease PerM n=1 Tax=Yoonia ponticola TaxID=1524255 RepID=A0A7W9BP65_9RHOB|nr:AI-2E family transporter [Yoonia ponticola]MBB5723990.1 putative PurR-regulated permease PerM [Yoonia ponticola]
MEDDIKALRRGVNTLITISAFVLAYFAKALILPIVIGFLIALTLSPINRALQKIGIPAAVGATILIIFATLVVGSAGYFAGETIRVWAQDIPSTAEELREKLSSVSSAIDAMKDVSEDIEEMTAANSDAPQQAVVEQSPIVNSALSVVAGLATSAGISLILALFLLASGNMFYVKLVQTFRTVSERKRALTTVYDIERRVSTYLLTITMINAGLGVVMTLALYAMGLEDAYVWGIAAFLLNYLPILGGLIGTVLVGVHAIIYFDTLSYAIMVPIVYQTITAFEANFVTPYLVGRRMEVNIVAVFLTVVLWAWLWGIAGALVAVPFLLVFKVVCDNFTSLNTFGNFLGVAETGERQIQ